LVNNLTLTRAVFTRLKYLFLFLNEQNILKFMKTIILIFALSSLLYQNADASNLCSNAIHSLTTLWNLAPTDEGATQFGSPSSLLVTKSLQPAAQKSHHVCLSQQQIDSLGKDWLSTDVGTDRLNGKQAIVSPTGGNIELLRVSGWVEVASDNYETTTADQSHQRLRCFKKADDLEVRLEADHQSNQCKLISFTVDRPRKIEVSEADCAKIHHTPAIPEGGMNAKEITGTQLSILMSEFNNGGERSHDVDDLKELNRIIQTCSRKNPIEALLGNGSGAAAATVTGSSNSPRPGN
jgi:hypothetical protein